MAAVTDSSVCTTLTPEEYRTRKAALVAACKIVLHEGDLSSDTVDLALLIRNIQPTEIYNLAAQTNVKVSYEKPEYTGNLNGFGALRFLEAIRTCGLTKHVRFYQAASSELFGKADENPQSETTPFHPRSPYGVSKLYAFWIVKCYRESYEMYACSGIAFNHESPRRGADFLTRKISKSVAAISLGLQDSVALGNLSAERDWGHTADYVEGMWRMLQQDTPDDYVLATGETHSVREFAERAFAHIGIEIKWIGAGVNEVGRSCRPEFLSKAERVLGWKRAISFDELVKEMVLADIKAAKL